MATREARALWHPTRARIFELVKTKPHRRSRLAASTDAPYAEVAYHIRALCQSGCIKPRPALRPYEEDPFYELP